MTAEPTSRRSAVVACDDVARCAELGEAIDTFGRHDITLSTLDARALDRTRASADLVVAVLTLSAPKASATRIAAQVSACIDATVTRSEAARRLLLVHLVDRNDAHNLDRFWLGEHLRGRVRLATDAGEEVGVGVSLIRFVADDPGANAGWADDVAHAVTFLDSLPPSVIVPELELAR